MSARADIAVVIVGFNSRRYLAKCLSSLQAADWAGYSHTVVYVDNASVDGSLDFVQQEFPAAVAIANAQNVGFCAACNQGAAAVDSRYVYLLNSDAYAMRDSIVPLAAFLDGHPSAGAAGNRLLNPDLSDQWSARRFPSALNAVFGRRSALSRRFPSVRPVRHYLYKDQLESRQPFAVDWVPGSCSLVRRDAYEAIGGLPERMHYWSDAVFCDRLHKAGWDVYVVPDAPLIHEEGHGTGRKSPAVREWLITDFHTGAYRFYCEHYALGPWHPARWLARIALAARARVLVAADAMRHADRAAS